MSQGALAYQDIDVDDYDLIHQELSSRLGDRRWRMDNLYWIITKQAQEVKFRMWFVQKYLYYFMWFFNLILKSRQHGITTFICLLFLDTCLFNNNIQAAIIAHNKVDAANFFNRYIKHPYSRLPQEVKNAVPLKEGTRGSANLLEFANGSSIRVTMSGRSGNYHLLHVSEYAYVCKNDPIKANEIKTGALNTVHPGGWLFIECTAMGREGDFYTKCQDSQKLSISGRKLAKIQYKFLFFPWYLNASNQIDPIGIPILNYQTEYFKKIEGLGLMFNVRSLSPAQKAWYVIKWNEQGDDMKREHPSTPEEAFEAAIMGTYYSSQFVKIREDSRITKVPHQSASLVDTWWDLGIRDSTAIWFTQDIGREIHVIDYYENSGEGLKHYKKLLNDWTKKKGYRYGIHGAPHDIRKREFGAEEGQRLIESAARIGIKFHIAPKLLVPSGIEQVRQVLDICWFDEERTTKKFRDKAVGVPSLENYRKEWNEALGCYRDTPLHDWCSDGADAFRTGAVGYTPQLRELKFAPKSQVVEDIDPFNYL